MRSSLIPLGLLAGGLLAATTLPMSAPASAKDDSKAGLKRPAIFEDLVNCREVEDPDERLACYDDKVAALDEAQKKDDIIVTDRAAVKEAKRGLFGFNLPKIKIFGGGDDDKDEIKEIDGIIASVSSRGGKWLITLEDGAKWQQISSERLALPPKAGMPVHIRKAAFGSFLVNIRGQRSIRMRRVN